MCFFLLFFERDSIYKFMNFFLKIEVVCFYFIWEFEKKLNYLKLKIYQKVQKLSNLFCILRDDC